MLLNTLRVGLYLSLLFALSGCIPGDKASNPSGETASSAISSVSAFIESGPYYGSKPCDQYTNPFVVESENQITEEKAYGTFTLSGFIHAEQVNAVWDDKSPPEYYTEIRLKSQDTQSSAFQYHKEKSERGNSVNEFRDSTLYFKLGKLTDGQLESTASFSAETSQSIVDALGTNQAITLKLTVPERYAGMGATPDFSFACSFEAI